jgi:Sulfotransferase domain
MTVRGLMADRVKPTAMVASLWWGHLTTHARILPDFLIVGAQRCGTTSLYRALVQHPAVLRPALRKGIHYFDTSYDRGPAWYRAHFPLQATAALVEGRVGSPAHTFESSPYYMFHPLAGKRIARDLPAARLIVLLRDPVERAYSAHTHEFARGYEDKPFEEALELEKGRLAGEEERLRADPTTQSLAHQHHGYLARGRYIEQIERLESLVGRDRLHVVDSESFFTEPEETYDEVLNFLGIPRLGTITFDRHNARPRSPMPESLRARLVAYYEPYDARLADWLGRRPSWRR